MKHPQDQYTNRLTSPLPSSKNWLYVDMKPRTPPHLTYVRRNILLFIVQPVWPPGLHWGLFHAVSNLVTQQSVVFDMPVKGCKTKDNVTVEIDFAIVFRIMGDASRVRTIGSNILIFVNIAGSGAGISGRPRGLFAATQLPRLMKQNVFRHERTTALAFVHFLRFCHSLASAYCRVGLP